MMMEDQERVTQLFKAIEDVIRFSLLSAARIFSSFRLSFALKMDKNGKISGRKGRF